MNEQQVGIKTPEYVSLKFELAGVGSRAAAFLLDQCILWAFNILVFIGLMILLVGSPDIAMVDQVNTYIVGGALILIFIVNYGYFFAVEFFSGGRTIGKKALGIRVIQENGHSVTLLSSLIRNLLRLIDSLPFGYLVGILMVFFHPKHKRLGDLVAGTIVVHERRNKKKRRDKFAEELARRGVTKESLPLEGVSLTVFTSKDWKLLRTYSTRLFSVAEHERTELTRQVAELLLPKAGLEIVGRPLHQLEDMLLALYLRLKEEWEYEI